MYDNIFQILAELAHDRIFEDYPTIALKVKYKVIVSSKNRINIFSKDDDPNEFYLQILTDGVCPKTFAYDVAKAFKGVRNAIATRQLQLN